MKLFILPTDTCFGIATPINDIEGYKKIYDIKKRDLDKPLAILVDSFEFLKQNTNINKEQIEFLKKYKNPYTVLLETKNELINDSIPNKNNYQKVAFRLAHNFTHHKQIRLNGPLFLTSANKTGECELFSSYDVREIFKNDIENHGINVFAHPGFCIDSKQQSSDIFEFIGDTTEVNYLRNIGKN